MRQKFITKCDILLQNATATLSQNASEVYYKMRQFFYYKMRQFYYKMRQLLQNATILLQNATVITKCDVYYKLRTVQQLKARDPRLIIRNSHLVFTLQQIIFY